MERERRWPLSPLIVGFVLSSIFAAWVYLGPGRLWVSGISTDLTAWWNAFASWYQLKLEGSAKLLAPLITIISGTYAIVKAYKYAEARLHLRLHEYLRRDEKRLHDGGSKLRMLVDKPGVRRSFVEPAFLDDSLRSAVRELGWGSYFLPPQMGLVEYQLGTAIAQLQRQVSIANERQRHFDKQLTTAHLLKGALWMGSASEASATGESDRVQLTNAASHFAAALQIDPNDEEALEYAAHVHIRLGQTDEATDYLEKLLHLTAKVEKSLTRARALRSSARIEENEGKNRNAVRHLRKALEVLPNLFGEDRIEEAEINEALADCQKKLGFTNQARAHWRVAEALYGVVQTDEAERRMQCGRA